MLRPSQTMKPLNVREVGRTHADAVEQFVRKRDYEALELFLKQRNHGLQTTRVRVQVVLFAMFVLEIISLIIAVKFHAVTEDAAEPSTEDRESVSRCFCLVAAGGLIGAVIGAGYFRNFVVEPRRYVERCNTTLREFHIRIDPQTMRLCSLKS